MIVGKAKLSIFIHRDITEEQRRTPGFRDAILFAPQLYAAVLSPVPYKGDAQNKTAYERFMDELEDAHRFVKEAFTTARRVEVRIVPHPADALFVDLVFFARGAAAVGSSYITFAIYLNGEWGAGGYGNKD